MANFAKDNAARLKTVGIVAKNEQEAREKMLKFLAQQEMDGVDDEDSETLLELCETWAEEVEEETAEEVEEETAEEVDEVEEVDELEEADEVDPKVVAAGKKAAQAKKAAEAKKTAEKKAATEKKTEKKEKSTSPKTRKLNINSKDDLKLYDPLKEVFPTAKYEYNFLTNGGVTILKIAKNAKFPVCGFDTVKVEADGSLKGSFYFNAFRKKKEDLAEVVGEREIFTTWSKLPYVKGVTIEDAIEFCTSEQFQKVLKSFEAKDKQLGESREKMEKQIEEKNKKVAEASKKVAAKKPAAPAPEEVEEVDEVEEVEEVEEPAPKANKAAAKTAAAKKK
jgi:hypothetical protein